MVLGGVNGVNGIGPVGSSGRGAGVVGMRPTVTELWRGNEPVTPGGGALPLLLRELGVTGV